MTCRSTLVLVLLVITATCLAMALPGCISDPKEHKTPVNDPGEPPDDPPPPPPPPPGDDLPAATTSVVSITESVLTGGYGADMQRVLATEIATCLNGMQAEGMVQIAVGDGTPRIEPGARDGGDIIYDAGYLVDALLRGEFGEQPRLTLHAFARSFDAAGEPAGGR